MKRYISLLLAAVMALIMTACGGRSDTDTEDIGGTVRPGVTENTGTGTVRIQQSLSLLIIQVTKMTK